MMAELRALFALTRSTFRRQLRSRKTLLCCLLLAMLAFVVVAANTMHPWDAKEFVQFLVLRAFGLFYLPMVALAYGTGALGDDREERTLSYLLVRPLPRSGLYLVKLLAVTPIGLAFSVGGLWLLLWLARACGGQGLEAVLGVCVPVIVLGTIAYLAFFHLLGAMFKHSTVIAIAYVFLIEVFVGRLPGIVKRVSMSFYTWSAVYGEARSLGVKPFDRSFFRPMDGDAAMAVLVGIATASIVLGALLFARREHADPA